MELIIRPDGAVLFFLGNALRRVVAPDGRQEFFYRGCCYHIRLSTGETHGVRGALWPADHEALWGPRDGT